MFARICICFLALAASTRHASGQAGISYTFGPGTSGSQFTANFSSSNPQLQASQFQWNNVSFPLGSQTTITPANVVGMTQNGDSFVRLNLTGSSSTYQGAEIFLTTSNNATVNAGAPGAQHSDQGLFAKPLANDGSYVSFAAVLRTTALQSQSNPVGVVSAFFGYPRAASANGPGNEIDVEILRRANTSYNNSGSSNLLLTTHYTNNSTPTLYARQISNTATSGLVDYSLWNTYQFRQYYDHVEFYLNGTRLASELTFPATDGQKLAPTFNIWAPGLNDFPNAYVAGNGTPLVGTNIDVKSFSYEVVPVPEPAHMLLVAVVGLLARRRLKPRTRA